MLRNRHLMMHHLMKNNVAAVASSPVTSCPDPVINESKSEPTFESVPQMEMQPEKLEEVLSPMMETQENEVPSIESLPQQTEDMTYYKAEEPKKKNIGVKSKIV